MKIELVKTCFLDPSVREVVRREFILRTRCARTICDRVIKHRVHPVYCIEYRSEHIIIYSTQNNWRRRFLAQ